MDLYKFWNMEKFYKYLLYININLFKNQFINYIYIISLLVKYYLLILLVN